MKKRDKIIISIIIIVALIAALVVLLFYLNSRNIIKIGNDNKTKQDEQIQEEVSIVQKQAKEKYPDFKWVSDGNIAKFVEVIIEDGKVILNNGTKTDVKFDKGTPKYASAVINGGVLKEIFVITTDGDLYITKSDITGYNAGDKFEVVNLGEKVIDATYADGTDMYYLLVNGKLVTKDLKEFVAFETKALEVQKQAKEKYPSFKWVSDGNIAKFVEVIIEDGKVILNNGTKTDVKFDKGTPKYASAVINGGVLKEIFVITTDGDLYITKSDITGYNAGDKFEVVNLGEKVIDATYADGTDMYYLLVNGKLVTKDLKEFVAFETKALEVQKQAKEKYPSFKWVSDGNITKLQVGIENGNVYIIGNEATGSKKYVKFDKGTPKYASAVIKGGMLEGIFVITTDGYLYFSSADGYGENGFEFEFEFHNLDEKVIDATYADGTDMYYLLEDGTIVNSNGRLK